MVLNVKPQMRKNTVVFLNESSNFSFPSFTSSSVRVENQPHVFVLRENVSRNGTPAIGTCSVNTIVLNISRYFGGFNSQGPKLSLFHAVFENCCKFFVGINIPALSKRVGDALRRIEDLPLRYKLIRSQGKVHLFPNKKAF